MIGDDPAAPADVLGVHRRARDGDARRRAARATSRAQPDRRRVTATRPSASPPACTTGGHRPGTVVELAAADGDRHRSCCSAALARLGAVQSPIIPILREREVRYITNEARTEVLRSCDRRGAAFDYEALAERSPTRSGAGARHRHAADGRSAALPDAARPGAGAALAVLHVGLDVRSQGRVAHRPVGASRACTRSSTSVQPTPDDVYPDGVPRLAHRRRLHARRGAHDGLSAPADRGVRRRAEPAVHGRAGRHAARQRAAVLPGVPRRAARARDRAAVPAAARPASAAARPSRRGSHEEIKRGARRAGRRRAAGGSPSSPSPRRRQRRRHRRADRDERGHGRRRASRSGSSASTASSARPARKVSCDSGARSCSSATRTPRSTPTRSTSEGCFRTGDLGRRRRHRPRHHHGQGEGHHHPQRGEHRRQRDRGCAAPAPRDRRRCGDRPARPAHR